MGMNTTTNQQIADIDRQSDKGFGPNPVATVKCPHCGGTMQAIDAKAHVRSQGR